MQALWHSGGDLYNDCVSDDWDDYNDHDSDDWNGFEYKFGITMPFILIPVMFSPFGTRVVTFIIIMIVMTKMILVITILMTKMILMIMIHDCGD